MKKLLNILACPVCKQPVELNKEHSKLLCTSCHLQYKIKDNIPMMLDEESEKELKDYINSSDGQNMVKEYGKKGLFLKLYKTAVKITGGSNFHTPVKKRLQSIINSTGENGFVLEIGSGNHRLDEKVINFDICHFKNVDIVGNGSKLPFQNDSIHAILLLAVLEHTRQPQKVIDECYRVLKKNGIIYAEVPFVFRYHSYPTDFWRFSLQGIDEMFHKFSKQDVGVCVGPSSGLLTFLTHYATLFSFSNNFFINRLIKGLTFCFLFPLKYLDLLLVKNQRAHELAAGIYFMGKKK